MTGSKCSEYGKMIKSGIGSFAATVQLNRLDRVVYQDLKDTQKTAVSRESPGGQTYNMFSSRTFGPQSQTHQISSDHVCP